MSGCVYTANSCGQISFSCTNPSGSLSTPSRVSSCTLFWGNLLHLLMWLIVLSLSLHNQHLQLCCVIYFCFNILIIIMSCHQHGYPWPSLATSPYRSSPLAGLQGYIPYPHIAAGCMFELVVLLLRGHMWGSIGVHHLWVRPCFSSSVLHVWFI